MHYHSLTQLLSSLVVYTFTIVTQPSLIVNTNNRFTAAIKLLVDEKLNLKMISAQVTVMIISQTQASIFYKTNKPIRTGRIFNKTGTVENQQAIRQLSQFQNNTVEKDPT